MTEDSLHDSWIVGSAADCDICLKEPTVSGHHCRLTRAEDAYRIEDLGSTNGTFVDGVRLAPRCPVSIHAGQQAVLANIPFPWNRVPGDKGASRSETVAMSAGPQSASGSQIITIGRSPESDVTIDLPSISWNHARVLVEDGIYILEDCNSRNGTAVGQLSDRIQRVVLDPESDVFLGSYKISASQLISPRKRIEIGDSACYNVEFAGQSMVIGRDPQCDVPITDHPMISWRHARLTRTPEGMLVEDLGSRNGTFVNQVRITGKVLVKPGQDIGLGSYRFQLAADGKLVQREYYGNVTIEANGIVVCAPNGKRLLDPVSLTVFPSELVALMGPAGSGKTTLLKALNGYTPPVEGRVFFNGQSLYDYYDLYRQQMGYVPQDDIVHAQLTVRQALYFSARLRTDLSDKEITARTEQVLHSLDIPDKIDTVIGSPERKTLSGGQRKRVNIALELITDTPVLFLDEPTSGLSSYDAEKVVDLLKKLSRSGKTVITTIHQPSLKVYKQFDDLIMISRDKGGKPGAMVYFGPAFPDSIQFFNPPDLATGPAPELIPEALFEGMEKVPEVGRTETWAQRYQNSRYSQEFIAGRSGKQPEKAGKTGEEKPRRQFGLSQSLALMRRNVLVKVRDRAQSAILLAQAPFFAVLVCMIGSPLHADRFDELAQKLPSIHFLLAIAAIWFGCNNAARDIVGEWTVYRRERMVTLKLIPYVISKLAVLFGLCVFQCASMLVIVYYFCGLHSSFWRDLLILITASMIGAATGLCISAFSNTTESAIALLPVALLPVIALGGGMRAIYLLPQPVQYFSEVIPSRWTYEATILQEAKAKEWAQITEPDPTCGLNPQDQDLNLTADIAENTIPRYVMSFTPEGEARKTCRVTETQSYPKTNPTVHAVSLRHRFRDLWLYLVAMFTALMLTALAILAKRDKDPQ